jgi:hypothetical protein
MLLDILRGTPGWVFVLGAILVWLGLRSLKPRISSVTALLITPTVFITWGLFSLTTRAVSSGTLPLAWLLAVVAGLVFALWAVGLRGVRVDRSRRLVFLPGTSVPLIRNTGIFGAKYCLGVAAALQPEAQAELAFWDLAVSGASAGYFLGWLIRFVGVYRETPSIDLTTTTVSNGAAGLRRARTGSASTIKH